MGSPELVIVRNEVDSNCEYHCDALADQFPDAREVDYPAGERPDLDRAAGVVLTGSTVGVYEVDDRPWIADQQRLVRDLIDRELPTLGVCFGHQLVNAALGGTVEHVGTTCQPVEASFADDPLFADVSSIVPVAHGDVVTEAGAGLDVIASAEYYEVFGTRHREAPLWTVQFHPEFTAALRDRLVADFGWTDGGGGSGGGGREENGNGNGTETDTGSGTEAGFEAIDAARVCENFRSIVAEMDGSDVRS